MPVLQAEQRRSAVAPMPMEPHSCETPAEFAPCAPGPGSWRRTVVSLWLLFHVSAIVIYPAAILVPPRGLLRAISDVCFERYMEALYMVQGHRFFAPEPGPGTMIAYRIERADGSVEENIFPRREISPRLMYHRHFMLSERVQDVGVETEWYRMYARHLAHVMEGSRVTLWQVVHQLPTPEDILAGKRLDDDEFYERRELGSWSRAELDEPWEVDESDFITGDEGPETVGDAATETNPAPAEVAP
jgi:hypothetical protein